MIHSMTAFGTGSAENDHGSLKIECRTVNSRFLDINVRLPEDLRFLEGRLREQITARLQRGKVDLRIVQERAVESGMADLPAEYLEHLARQLSTARQILPDVRAPELLALISGAANQQKKDLDAKAWTALCDEALEQTLKQVVQARRREGQRLAESMCAAATNMAEIVTQVEQAMPDILEAHQKKIVERLQEALSAADPDGFAQIDGSELSARLAQEASLFAMRSDVAEELARLRSHIEELRHLLQTGQPDASRRAQGSTGKRLDFLCQEMNREANTLGSKAAGLAITNAAIDAKLLIEQLREQAQNIE